MLRLSCQLPWFRPCSQSQSQSRLCPRFTPLPWKLPFVQYWSHMFACTFASVQFATDCHTISPSSIGSNHATQQASWACVATTVHIDLPIKSTKTKEEATLWSIVDVSSKSNIFAGPCCKDNLLIITTYDQLTSSKAFIPLVQPSTDQHQKTWALLCLVTSNQMPSLHLMMNLTLSMLQRMNAKW